MPIPLDNYEDWGQVELPGRWCCGHLNTPGTNLTQRTCIIGTQNVIGSDSTHTHTHTHTHRHTHTHIDRQTHTHLLVWDTAHTVLHHSNWIHWVSSLWKGGNMTFTPLLTVQFFSTCSATRYWANFTQRSIVYAGKHTLKWDIHTPIELIDWCAPTDGPYYWYRHLKAYKVIRTVQWTIHRVVMETMSTIGIQLPHAHVSVPDLILQSRYETNNLVEGVGPVPSERCHCSRPQNWLCQWFYCLGTRLAIRNCWKCMN